MEPYLRKILLESELFIMQNVVFVDMGVANSCTKYCVFVTTGFDAIRICIQHCERWHGHKNLHFHPLFGGRVTVSKTVSMFALIVISMVAYVF